MKTPILKYCFGFLLFILASSGSLHAQDAAKDLSGGFFKNWKSAVVKVNGSAIGAAPGRMVVMYHKDGRYREQEGDFVLTGKWTLSADQKNIGLSALNGGGKDFPDNTLHIDVLSPDKLVVSYKKNQDNIVVEFVPQ